MRDHNLVQGATVCVADEDGEIARERGQGLFHRDVRVVSTLAAALTGFQRRSSAGERTGPGAATWLRVLGDRDDATAVLVRHERVLGDGLVDRFTVEVTRGVVEGEELRIAVAADFAEITALHADAGPPDEAVWEAEGSATLRAHRGTAAVEARLDAPGARVAGDRLLAVPVHARRGEPFTATLTVAPTVDLTDVLPDLPQVDEAVPAPPPPSAPSSFAVAGDTVWEAATASAFADLQALQVPVPELGLSYVAAGAPWYMALFGRDSLLAAHFLLPTGQAPGLEVLRTLARFQGRAEDPRTLEQPGKILHELRTGGAGVFGLPPLVPYYGTVDASPLFVMLLGELHRWGAPESAVLELLPAARAALDWCAGPGDADGDGFLEYRSDSGGLANQGWKDHDGAMVHADGSAARGPIAVAEAQAYHYAALRELALLEERLGEPDTAAVLRGRADALSAAFIAAYWLPEEGLLAMALDGDKRPLAVASSNIGHCLWTGILPADIAAAAAARLRQPDLLTAWGVRTLGSQERAYDPLSYHLGSVWPHDSAICAAGLARAGDREGAAALVAGLLRVAGLSGWRLPELYGGLDADQVPFPVPTPVACSPQAWSAAAPLSLLRTALGLEPDVPRGTVRLAPLLPPGERLTAHGIALGGGTLTVTAEGTTVLDADLPPGLTLA